MNEAASVQTIRSKLHASIDRLRDEDLALAHRLILEIQLMQAMDELDESADAARREGRLTPEAVASAVASHRAKYPYKV